MANLVAERRPCNEKEDASNIWAQPRLVESYPVSQSCIQRITRFMSFFAAKPIFQNKNLLHKAVYPALACLAISTPASAYQYCQAQDPAGDTAWDINDNGSTDTPFTFETGDVWTNVLNLDDVSIRGKHQYAGDLAASMISPDNTEVILFRLGDGRYGEGASNCSRADFDISFSDNDPGTDLSVRDQGNYCVGTNNRSTEGNYPRPYLPNFPDVGDSPALQGTAKTYNSEGLSSNLLSNFIGDDPAGGAWNLRMVDAYNQDFGTLEEVCVNMDFASVTYDMWVSSDETCTDKLDNATFFVGDEIHVCYVASNEATQNFTLLSEVNNHGQDLTELSGAYTKKLGGTQTVKSAVRTFTAGDASTPLGTTTLSGTITVEGTDTHFSSGQQLTTSEQVQITVRDPESDLSLFLWADTLVPLSGTQVTYTVEVTNSGDDDATGVVISLPLDTNHTYASDSSGGAPGEYVDYNPVTGLWNVGNIAVNATEILELVVTATGSGISTITTTAEVWASDNDDPDSTPANGPQILLPEDDDDTVIITPAIALTATPLPTGPAFLCNTNFYQVLSGALNVLDPVTTSYSPIGSSQPNYNAAGYNIIDNYIYGVGVGGTATNQLVRINSDGTQQLLKDLGHISYRGDMNRRNELVYREGSNLWAVNVTTGVSRLVMASSPALGGDFVHRDTGLEGSLVGVEGSIIRVLDLDSLTYDDKSYIGDMVGQSGAFGAIWGGSGERIFMFNNASGNIYYSDDWETSSTPTTILAGNAGPNGGNDGMACALALVPTFPPVAYNDVMSAFQDQDSIGNVLDDNGLGADFDPEGTPLTVNTSPVIGPGSGSVVLNADGSFVYTPNPGFSGVDSFTYEVADQENQTATAVVTLTVLPPPTADLSLSKTANTTTPGTGSDVTFTITVTNEEASGGDTAIEVIVRDVLPEGLTYVSDSSGGTVGSPVNYDPVSGEWDVGSVAANSSVSLDIVAIVSGVATITNSAEIYYSPAIDNDSTPNNQVASEDDQDSISITPVIAPVAYDDTVEGIRNRVRNGDVLIDNGNGTDYDPNGYPLIVNTTLVSSPSNGSVVLNSDGTFSYTPDTNFTGTDSFEYEISNVAGGTDRATVTLSIISAPLYYLYMTKEFTANDDADNSGTVSVGDTLTYRITANNGGVLNILGVTVQDNMLTPSSTYCGTLIFSNPCVLEGTYKVTAADESAGLIYNEATATSITASAIINKTVVVPPGADPAMSVSKSQPTNSDEDGSGTISLGDTLTYMITATNTGKTTLNNLTITDSLTTPNSKVCASVIADRTCTLIGTYTVTEADVAAGSITNTGQGVSDELPTPTADTVVTQIDRGVTRFQPDQNSVVAACTRVEYKHNLSIAADDVGLSAIASVSSSLGWDFDVYLDLDGDGAEDSERLTTLTTLPAAGDYFVYVIAQIDCGALEGSIDVADVTLVIDPGGTNETSLTVQDTTRILASGLGALSGTKQMSLDADCNGESDAGTFSETVSASPGECVIYRITMLNPGLGDISDPIVKDSIPHYTTYLDSSAAYVTNAALTPGVPSLPAGGSRGLINFPYSGTLQSGETASVQFAVKLAD
ncbi:putative repeat protein (TIGR01451 family) [Litorimonas taeanensis]|uniref:Putative repeat protein (TIGR01451 family) n=2 Tax=Litorimonas taeanensis TaxID=568099 RepID=A0A420WJE6_9PROT|nr:putative repeat protein (TIGR01451 family) [Litorimonas taeanensis]